MIELMNGYYQDSENPTLLDSDRWHPDALNFINATRSCDSAAELRNVELKILLVDSRANALQHRFLKTVRPDCLVGFVSLLLAWTRPKCEYIGWLSTESPT